MSLPLKVLLISVACLLAACGSPAALPTPQVLAATPTPTPFQIPSETPQPGPSATPDPYEALTISALVARRYGGGEMLDLGILGTNAGYTRHMVSYPSDGLAINGFIDIPAGDGPFPVVLVLHGYVDPEGYQVENYTARYAAAFANAGYIAIHPNYRNYPPSDAGPNEFRVGYAVDVLNLVAIVNTQAGVAGVLQAANPDAIFLWGHSMGGGISLRVITVGSDVQGAVLYGSMSGDERRNFERIRDVLSDGTRGNEELSVPDEVMQLISPIYYYERIAVPVSIHHGEVDASVPLAWSQELCEQLQALGKQVECFTYHNMPHTFYGENDQLLIKRSIEFFESGMP
ncbi:MAG TPA: alpha/beta fold hydrolase [Anaerolineales bacterium]|nr:alpha/beta fold hydrolase [Anaerolineales bacterium]